jgi:aryl carrier-like protein
MPVMISRLLLASLLLSAAAAEELVVDGLAVPVELSLPENHDPAKKWPAVFYYHGTGGQPSTKLIRQHTGPRDWIVVGMTYSFPGAFTHTPENLEKERVILRRVRDQLATRHGLDPKRLFVSGFSQGGWMSGLLFQAEPSLAGAVILGAGHMREITPKPAPVAPGTPLFLGVGRLDGTYPFALKGRLFFSKLGAAVTMETWIDLAHEFPTDGSPALKEWFTLRNGGTPDADAFEAEFREIGKLSPLDQWWKLLEFRERPFVTTPGRPWKETVARRITELEQDPAVARESKIFKRHRQLLADEINANTLPDLVTVNNAYVQLAQQAGDSPQVKLVVADAQRVAKLLATNKDRVPPAEAPKPLAPVLPRQDRGIPRNPLVK